MKKNHPSISINEVSISPGLLATEWIGLLAWPVQMERVEGCWLCIPCLVISIVDYGVAAEGG